MSSKQLEFWTVSRLGSGGDGQAEGRGAGLTSPSTGAADASMPRWPNAVPLMAVSICGLVLVGQWLLPPFRIGAYLFGHLALAALMIAVATGSWRVSARSLLLAALAGRGVLFFCQPYTTHDVERYLWDGALFLTGLDPYTVAPADAAHLPTVARLAEIWPTPAEHAAYPTIYPPLALAAFAACALAGPTWALWCWSGAATLASMAICWFAVMHLRPRQFAWLALNPLLILEAGVGAHVDVFAALGLAVFLFAYRSRPRFSAALLALGALFKYSALPILGPYLLAKRFTWSAVGTVIVASLLFVAGFAVLSGFGYGVLGSLPAFIAKWRFGSPLFLLLQTALGDANALLAAAAVTGVFYLGIAVLAWRRRLAGATLFAAALVVPLSLSPVFFPWYAMPVTVLLPLLPGVWRWGLATWVLLLPLTYEVLFAYESSAVWQPAVWPLWIIGVAPPVVMLLLGSRLSK